MEAGWGCDQHGQNVTVRPSLLVIPRPQVTPLQVLLTVPQANTTAGLLTLPVGGAQKAAVRACRNAIEFNSLPAVRKVVPGGYDNLRLHVKLGSPRPVSTLDAPQTCLWLALALSNRAAVSYVYA